MKFPVDFQEKARGAKQASGSGYPVQISASDLMSNFYAAALDADTSLIEEITQNGLTIRKLKIPAVPNNGTFVLGAVGGQFQWLATEQC